MSYRQPLYSPNSPKMMKGGRREQKQQREPPPPPPPPPSGPTQRMIRQRGGMSLSGSGNGSGSGSERTTPATAMPTTTMSTEGNGVGVEVGGGVGVGGVDSGGSSSSSNGTANGMVYGNNDNGHDADVLEVPEMPEVPEEQSNIPTIRSRPWVRLDRLLRRWLPGYTLLRSLAAGGASSDVATGTGQQTSAAAGNNQAEMATGTTGTGIGIGTMTTSGQNAFSQQQQHLQQQRATVRLVSYGGAMEPSLVVRKRHDGEVFLDTGIAKSEFCLKLEKLLRAKLVEKE